MADSRHRTTFILATIFIDAMGFGLIMPVLPRLLIRIGDLTLSQAIDIGSWMGLAMALASFFAAPVIGNASDRFGRRPMLLCALGLLAIDYVVMATATSLALLFVTRALSGAFGGSFAAAQSALADSTPPEQRARAFGLVSAAFGVGFIIGPALGGLLGEYGDRAPFIAAAALAGANFVYGLTLFPETLPIARRRAFAWSRANPLGALRAARAIPGMMAAAMVLVLWQIASLVYPITWSFYAIAAFGWSPRMIGVSLAVVGAVIALSQTVITGPAVKRFGERDAATIGLVAAMSGFVIYAFARSTAMAFVPMIAISLQSLVQPSLMAMLSRRATPETQGEVQGIAAMAMGVGSVVAPLLLTQPLAWFTNPASGVYFPGAAFIVATAVALVALVRLRALPRSVVAEGQPRPGAA